MWLDFNCIARTNSQLAEISSQLPLLVVGLRSLSNLVGSVMSQDRDCKHSNVFRKMKKTPKSPSALEARKPRIAYCWNSKHVDIFVLTVLIDLIALVHTGPSPAIPDELYKRVFVKVVSKNRH